MTKERIEKAIEIINYAIKNQISVSEASIKCGYASSYIKNIKALVFEKYETRTLDDELFNMFNETYQKYRNGSLFNETEDNDNTSFPSTRKSVPIEKKTNISNLRNGKDKLVVNQKDENKIIVEWNGNVGEIKTLDDLLKKCNVDLNVWYVKDYTVNKWDVTSWKSGRAETHPNFQVKARLERRVELNDAKIAANVFNKMIKKYELPETINITPKKIDSDENNLLEISIFDLHIGKLAWKGETGENFDTKIARSRFISAIKTLIERAKGFNYNKILFPVGNDFFNSDTIFNTTTQGTPQDEDLRWQKTFTVGATLLVDAINILKQTGVPIDILVIPGNHDFERSYYMGSYLDAWFHNDSMVNVNNEASPRKYYNFGKVLLGFTHGSEEKESSLPLLMATDIGSKRLWSDTKYHEWHLGHQHRKRNINYNVIDVKSQTLTENLGVTIRYLSSLTGTEEWHHKKGFIGQIKAADGFIWNDKMGLLAHLNANIKI